MSLCKKSEFQNCWDILVKFVRKTQEKLDKTFFKKVHL